MRGVGNQMHARVARQCPSSADDIGAGREPQRALDHAGKETGCHRVRAHGWMRQVQVSFSLAQQRDLVQPEVTLLRQGEGDLHLPHPPVSAYPVTPGFLAGVVERTLRLATGADVVRGRWTLSGDAGVHLISNAAHVSGASKTRWVGTVQLTWRTKKEGRLP